MMGVLFDICVQIMIVGAKFLGITYKEFNIWLFVIIHPIITLYFFWLYRKYKKKFNNAKSN